MAVQLSSQHQGKPGEGACVPGRQVKHNNVSSNREGYYLATQMMFRVEVQVLQSQLLDWDFESKHRFLKEQGRKKQIPSLIRMKILCRLS